MGAVKSLWVIFWKIALVAGFGGLAVFGLGLMVGSVWYSTGIFWRILTFVLGVFGILLAAAAMMTEKNRPGRRPA